MALGYEDTAKHAKYSATLEEFDSIEVVIQLCFTNLESFPECLDALDLFLLDQLTDFPNASLRVRSRLGKGQQRGL
jgi:hypothetical protein